MSLFLTSIDLSKNELRNARVHNLAAAPASPALGQLYYDTGNNTVFYYNGTSWISTSGGTPADATTTTKGVVQLAGDLTGTAASPAVASLAITAGKIANSTITDTQIAAANKDGTTATPSLRTIGTSAQQAMAGNTTLSSIAAPTTDVSLASHKLTNVLDPTGAQDAATKNYVDNTTTGLSAKTAVHAATTANIANLASASTTQDGVTLVAGDRLLVKDQTTPSQNGIYTVGTVSAGTAPLTRANDMNSWTEVPASYVWVQSGTTQADTGWVCTSQPGGTLETTAITWVQFSASTEIGPGNGLTKSGNTLAVLAANTTLTVTGSGVAVSATYPGNTSLNTLGTVTTGTWQGTAVGVGFGGTGSTTAAGARTALGATTKFATQLTGDGVTTAFTITHNLGTQDINLQVFQAASPFNKVEIDVAAATTNTATVTFAVAPASATNYRAVVVA